MSIIDRSDLKYDYIWSAEPAKQPRSETTTKNATKPNIFRADEGEKVLTFLNGYAKSRNISDKEEVSNVESLIHQRLKKEDETTTADLEVWLDEQRKK